MANTTFTGPVTALNGFIGGANTNPHTGSADTQQGGNVAWTVDPMHQLLRLHQAQDQVKH
jgi:hypothetical protein